MPVKRVPLDDLEAAVESIERSARLVSLTMVGEGAVLVAYEKTRKQDARETRG